MNRGATAAGGPRAPAADVEGHAGEQEQPTLGRSATRGEDGAHQAH